MVAVKDIEMWFGDKPWKYVVAVAMISLKMKTIQQPREM
jgi:hypothetical protein